MNQGAGFKLTVALDGWLVTKNLPSSVLKRGILATFKAGVHPNLNDILRDLKMGKRERLSFGTLTDS